MSISSRSRYHKVLTDFLCGKYQLCVTTDILYEYEEILTQKMGPIVGNNIVNAIIANKNTVMVSPYYRFNLIKIDPDDNKFVDCAIYANAKYIVTEDSHYNILRQISFPKVEITGIDAFLDNLCLSHL